MYRVGWVLIGPVGGAPGAVDLVGLSYDLGQLVIGSKQPGRDRQVGAEVDSHPLERETQLLEERGVGRVATGDADRRGHRQEVGRGVVEPRAKQHLAFYAMPVLGVQRRGRFPLDALGGDERTLARCGAQPADVTRHELPLPGLQIG
jgi:hypothetical protein